MRESLLIPDGELRVVSANQSFYSKFQVKEKDIEKKLIYELGNNQWNIPKLRKLLEEIIPQNIYFSDFEVEHEFEHIGRRIMVLNARRVDLSDSRDKLILLAIEDVTEGKRAGGD